jgi:hypothetical protein
VLNLYWLNKCDHPTPSGHVFPPRVRIAHPLGEEKVHWTFSCLASPLKIRRGGLVNLGWCLAFLFSPVTEIKNSVWCGAMKLEWDFEHPHPGLPPCRGKEKKMWGAI